MIMLYKWLNNTELLNNTKTLKKHISALLNRYFK